MEKEKVERLWGENFKDFAIPLTRAVKVNLTSDSVN